MTCKQISVLMENKPGRASAIASVLDKNDIDIRALSMADTADYGIMRLIVDNPDQACDALKAAGFTSSVTEVLAVEMPDTKGALSGILNVLTASGINVEYAYAFVTRNRDKAF
ncbi:MAG: ACT domain-containing protein, partial [Firmicutes bacterium]|nr:ACT domain-containing protein [Bacillota bacterium]